MSLSLSNRAFQPSPPCRIAARTRRADLARNRGRGAAPGADGSTDGGRRNVECGGHPEVEGPWRIPLIQCFHCGSPLDAAMSECPACGAGIEVSRLTGVLGSVCRGCDAFNEPGTITCVSCGEPLAARGPAPLVDADLIEPEPGSDAPSPHDLPPIDFEAVLVEMPQAEPGPAPEPIDLLDPLPAPTPREFLPFESIELEPDAATASLSLAGPAGPCQLLLERGDGREGSGFPVGADEVAVGRSEGAMTFP